MTKAYLTAENLTHGYRDAPLFSGLSFSLPAGRVVQLTGKNGSGKTTLLHLLANLKPPQEGRVTREPDISLLYVGHQSAIKLELSPLENLRLYQPNAALCAQALDALELPLRMHNKPCYMLSAGQQRKVALSRLMLSNATLWLVDEPFTALDDSAKACITRHMEAHARKGGACVVATHDPLDIREPLLQKMSLS